MSLEELTEKLSTVNSRPDEIRLISEYILEQGQAFSSNRAVNSDEIIRRYNEIIENNPTLDLPSIPENSFRVILSRISKEPNTRITCDGRRAGYYLEELVTTLEESNDESLTQPQKNISDSNIALREKDFYVLLKNWFFEMKYDRVQVTSEMKKNGKWGNPDLVGLRIDHILTNLNLEIATIEFKLFMDNWQYWIFEAVAHSRFSNRSYFAFCSTDPLFEKIENELRLYADHYKIGLLIVELPVEEFKLLKEGKPFNVSKDRKVRELLPAPYVETMPFFRKKFLEAVGITDIDALYRFGSVLEE